MKSSFSAALKAHLAGTVQTIALLWKVTWLNGTILGFTSHQENISGTTLGGVHTGVTYEASTGFDPRAIRQTADLSVPNMNVVGFLRSPTITDEDLIAGKWDFATVEVFICNYKDLSMGAGQLSRGTLGQVRTGRVNFEAELRGMIQRLQQTFGRIIQPDCDAIFGDARCGIALGPITVAGAITAVTSRRIVADTSRSEATGYFTYGILTFTSGLNAGLSGDVKAFTSGTDVIEFFLAFPYDIAQGDTYSMTPGCDRSFPTCISKWNNAVNFRGFPHVPGLDWQTTGVR